MAASLAIRRQSFDDLGGFDREFCNGGEDTDLCLRVRAMGGRVVYVPDSVAFHFLSMTAGRLIHDQQNVDLLMSRWKGRWQDGLSPLMATVDAAGYDLDDRQYPAADLVNRFSEPDVKRLQDREREVLEMWTRLREKEDALAKVAILERRVEELGLEVTDLRLLVNLRSVRLALKAQRWLRRIFPG